MKLTLKNANHTSMKIEHKGVKFIYEIDSDSDYDMGYPWDEHDGHGEIVFANRTKRPHEVIVGTGEHGYEFFYDVKESLDKASREGWAETRVECAEAVKEDIRFCKRFLDDDICWQQIAVYPVGAPSEAQYLGGILSEWDDKHVLDCVIQLADEILANRERKYNLAKAYYEGM
jgi:hypothetical protein